MILGKKQERFSRLIPKLINKAHELGFEVRLKELLRGEIQAQHNADTCAVCGHNKNKHLLYPVPKHSFKPMGIKKSLHRDGLALDLVLFREGIPLTDSEMYLELGEFWESLDILCAWGGRFNDGGHFSIIHGGRK